MGFLDLRPRDVWMKIGCMGIHKSLLCEHALFIITPCHLGKPPSLFLACSTNIFILACFKSVLEYLTGWKLKEQPWNCMREIILDWIKPIVLTWDDVGPHTSYLIVVKAFFKFDWIIDLVWPLGSVSKSTRRLISRQLLPFVPKKWIQDK